MTKRYNWDGLPQGVSAGGQFQKTHPFRGSDGATYTPDGITGADGVTPSGWDLVSEVK